MRPRLDRWLDWDFRQLRDQIGPDNDVYMRRRQLFAIRFGRWIVQARINDICRADRDPNPHTHPLSFVSVIFSGRYLEAVHSYSALFHHVTCRWRERWSVAYRSRRCVHNIVELGTPSVRTLFVAFFDTSEPDYGTWGFMVGDQFVRKEDYFKINSSRQ